MSIRVGVVGGSGLYQMEALTDVEEQVVTTPFGEPSDAFILGKLDGVPVAFLPRHGRGHRFSPSEVNYRANVFGFKKLGVEWLISVSAVGSMKEDKAPGHLVLVDQFIDRTKHRESTFFSQGLVAHVPFADPICSDLQGVLHRAAGEAGAVVHKGGTYICIEGPQFSTRAESELYRSWGVDVIGMTNLPEAKLAREAGLCYATMALVTDYDCWHNAHDSVSVESVIAVLKQNVQMAQRTIRHAVAAIPAEGACVYRGAAKAALLTNREAIDPNLERELAPLFS